MKANWGIKSSAPILGVDGGGFCHSQALYLQDGLEQGSVHLILDPGLPGLGNRQSPLGVRGGGSRLRNEKSPNFGVTEIQVIRETASKFCHLSESPYLQKGILKLTLMGFDELSGFMQPACFLDTADSGRLLALLEPWLRAGPTRDLISKGNGMEM